MDVRTITRLTNAGLVAGIGMGAGHLLMPARATASWLSRVVFAVGMLGTGALVGWRERRGRELDGEEDVPGSQPVWLLVGAVVMVLLAWGAYRVAHG